MQHTGISKIVTGIAVLFGSMAAASAAVVVAVDMDISTPGIQAVRTVTLNEIFTVGLIMTADAAGVSSYGVSVNFDNAELTLSGAPASTELLPALFTGNVNPGVNSESQALGQIRTFEAFTFAAGPVSSSFTIGTISFKATAPVTDAFLDVTLGLFNVGIDGIFNNAGGDLGPGAVFVGGLVNVVPEPASAALLAAGVCAGLVFPRRKRARA